VTTRSQEARGLKEQLRRSPDKATIAALEKIFVPRDAVTGTQQLQGSWRLQGPRENGARGLISGDLPRMLLNLYSGNIGRMLSMELVDLPTVSISPDGQAETLTQLRWGSQQDTILTHTRLSMIGPNLLRETPQATRSSRLGAVPTLTPPRDLTVTYHDEDLLILRDSRGIVDALWRNQGEAERLAIGTATGEHRSPAEEATSPGSAGLGQGKGGKGARLLAELEELRASLEAQKTREQEEGEARAQLSGELKRMEEQLEKAAVAAHADSVKLEAIAKIQEQVFKTSQFQGQRSATKAMDINTLEAEVIGLRVRSAELEGNLNQYKMQESSLKNQIVLLESELITGARDAWPAYRAAAAQAREELTQVRGELKTASKEIDKLNRVVDQKAADLKRKSDAASAETTVRHKLEAQLAEQQREFFEAAQKLEKAKSTEQELRAELEALREKHEQLELREAESQLYAMSFESEINAMAAQVKAAKEVSQTLGSKEKRRFWVTHGGCSWWS